MGVGMLAATRIGCGAGFAGDRFAPASDLLMPTVHGRARG